MNLRDSDIITKGGPVVVPAQNQLKAPCQSASPQAVSSISDDLEPIEQKANLYTFYNIPMDLKLKSTSLQKLFENTYKVLITYQTITRENSVKVETKVLLPVRNYLRMKVNLPWAHKAAVKNYRRIAQVVPMVLEECINLASNEKPLYIHWVYNCMGAYVTDGHLKAMWDHLPDDFRTKKRTLGIMAAVLHSEITTLQFLLQQGPTPNLDVQAKHWLIESVIASRGDEIYSTLRRFAPTWVTWINKHALKNYSVERLNRFLEEKRACDAETLGQLLDYAVTHSSDAVFENLASKLGNQLIPAKSLLIAAENGRTELLKVIARNPENTHAYPLLTYSRMLISAVKNRHHETVRYLLTEVVDSGQRWPTIDPTAQGNEAFRYACFNEDIEMLEILLANGPNGTPLFPNVDISAYENSVLVTAISIGSMSMVKYILEKSSLGKDHRFAKVNFSEPNNRPLKESVCKRKFNVFKFILDETRAGNPKFVNVNPLSIQSTVCGMSDTRFAMELYRLNDDGNGFLFPGLSISPCQANEKPNVVTDFLTHLDLASTS